MHELDNVTQLALDGTRVGVITGGNAYVKEGGLGASWVHENDNVSQLALADNRIGVVTGTTALVKEGTLAATWKTMNTAALSIDLS